MYVLLIVLMIIIWLENDSINNESKMCEIIENEK